MTTRKNMLIETGRSCLMAQILSQYSAMTALDLEVTNDDQATDFWAEVDACAEAALLKRGLSEMPPADPAPSGAVTRLPLAEDWLRSA